MSETSITLTRSELYKRVWAVPMRQLCEEFGLSDDGLAKICERHNIPAPPRGVWAKKAHDKHARQPPLPTRPSGWDDETITIWRSTSRDSDCTPHPLPESSAVVTARTYESDPRNRITVPVNVRRFHRVVAQTRSQMKGASENIRGTTQPVHDCLDTSVSKTALPRAFRIMHALVTALDARGYRLLLPGDRSLSSPRHVGVEILGERIDFGLLGRVNQRPDPGRGTSSAKVLHTHRVLVFTATGRLVLRIKTGYDGHHYRWGDRGDCRLDDQLNDFVIGLVTEAVEQRRAREAREEDERRAAEAEERRRDEAERVRDLDEGVGAWIKNRRIRAYIAEVESAARRNGGIEVSSELDDWLLWAKAYADRTDPINGVNESAEGAISDRARRIRIPSRTRSSRRSSAPSTPIGDFAGVFVRP